MKQKVVRKKSAKKAQVRSVKRIDAESREGAKRVVKALTALTDLNVIEWTKGKNVARACISILVDKCEIGDGAPFLCAVNVTESDGIGGSAETICDLTRADYDELVSGITRSPLTKEVDGDLY